MNVELLLEIADRIAKRPEQFQMTDFWGESRCGTVCCIAGWAVQLRGELLNCCDVGDRAAKLLEIEYANSIWEIDDANRLFAFELWPPQFKRWKVEGTPEFADQAVRRIHWFIQTGGRE